MRNYNKIKSILLTLVLILLCACAETKNSTSTHSFSYDQQSSIISSSVTTNKSETQKPPQTASTQYIINRKSKKFHRPECYSVKQMNEKNKLSFKGDRQYLINKGYSPCGNCNP